MATRQGNPQRTAQTNKDRSRADRLAAVWIKRRRKALTASAAYSQQLNEHIVPKGALGLALSGGGIRSATLSLGLAQALSRKDRLLDFDYLSTVSGGGYVGSFLTGLFVPSSQRGAQKTPARANNPSPKAMREFAQQVLACDANDEQVELPRGWPNSRNSRFVRNPIWWLREHSRYLAPNGPTDYMFATAVIGRNWLAMIYTFFVAVFPILCLVHIAAWILVSAWDPSTDSRVAASSTLRAVGEFILTVRNDGRQTINPFFIIPAACLLVTGAAFVGYWFTTSLDTKSLWTRRVRSGPKVRLCVQASLGLCIAAALLILSWWSDRQPHPLFWKNGVRWGSIALVLDMVIAGALLCLLIQFSLRAAEGDIFTAEIRRRLTKVGAFGMWAALWMFAFAIIDYSAQSARTPLNNFFDGKDPISAIAALFAPLAAWLIGKVPSWLGEGKLRKLLGARVWTLALLAGSLSFALIIFVADLMVQSLMWQEHSMLDGHSPNWGSVIPFLVLSLLLFVGTAIASGFVNLSSLHGFYAGRLTRAYLGASNLDRLRAAAPLNGKAPITENHPGDHIDASRYRSRRCIAPIHLINVTLNETRSRSRSQIIDRDRKGVPVVFAPEGVLINSERSAGSPCLLAWPQLHEGEVDALSVGQLCAISGAAASSGMGSRTTLGGALAFTFANVRLGYWWTVNNSIRSELGRSDPAADLRPGLARHLGTFYYFFSEMTARYSLTSDKVYLSDGGHFENSGVYELLRRKVRVIVAGDFGEDPRYEFEDLENLIRKARIDLGLAIAVAPAEMVKTIFGEGWKDVFLNRHGHEWRAHVDDPASGCALLLNVFKRPPGRTDPQSLTPVARIIWLKPKMMDGLPEDLRGYAVRHPGFPQETTGDQFFDEAQWESYRTIGYALGQRLLGGTARAQDAIRASQIGLANYPD